MIGFIIGREFTACDKAKIVMDDQSRHLILIKVDLPNKESALDYLYSANRYSILDYGKSFYNDITAPQKFENFGIFGSYIVKHYGERTPVY